MKNILNITLLLFILIALIESKHNLLGKKSCSIKAGEFKKLTPIYLKNSMFDDDIFIVDTRENTISNKGYLKNSLLLPLTMGYSTWFPKLIKEGSKVILICDEDNYANAIRQTFSLGSYVFLGYAIYDEIVSLSGNINIQKAAYQENTKKDIDKLIQKGKYLVDIREVSEYQETGVIKEANLIPLSTFPTDFEKLPKKEEIYVFCKSGGRALLGMSYAQRFGYTNQFYIMRGGITKTISEGYPLVPYEG